MDNASAAAKKISFNILYTNCATFCGPVSCKLLGSRAKKVDFFTFLSRPRSNTGLSSANDYILYFMQSKMILFVIKINISKLKKVSINLKQKLLRSWNSAKHSHFTHIALSCLIIDIPMASTPQQNTDLSNTTKLK